MNKKVYINIFESPYVDMDNDYKIYRNEEPLPKHVFYTEKETKSNIVQVTKLLADEIANYSCNDIVRSYEGQSSIFIDILILINSDIESIKSIIDNSKLFTTTQTKSKNQHCKGILKFDNNYFFDEFEYIANKKIFSCTYEIGNLGATGIDFSPAELINNSFMVIVIFVFNLLVHRFFRLESRGTDGNKYLRYYNEKRILKQLRKRTNRKINSYEFVGHRIRKKKHGLVIEMRNKKRIYVIKTNAFSGIDSYKEYKSKDYVINKY